MKYVVIGLAHEKREDGQYHVFSSMVPGFHVLAKDFAQAYKEGVKILTETIRRRAEEIGRRVEIVEATTELKVVPDAIKGFRDGSMSQTTHLVAHFM